MSQGKKDEVAQTTLLKGPLCLYRGCATSDTVGISKTKHAALLTKAWLKNPSQGKNAKFWFEFEAVVHDQVVRGGVHVWSDQATATVVATRGI